MFLYFAAAGLIALAFAMQPGEIEWMDSWRQKLLQEKGHADMRVAEKPSAHVQIANSARKEYHTLSEVSHKKLKTYLRAESDNAAVRKQAAAEIIHLGYRKGGKAGGNLRPRKT